MRKTKLIVAIVLLAGPIVLAQDPTVKAVTHSELQSVNTDGYGTYTATDKVTITGIVLNSPEQMLNPAPGAGYMGGQWQMYIQGEGSDHAGTAVWFGQYYSRVSSSDDYTDLEFLDELFRINTDPDTGYVFNPGDRVQVTGWYKFYKGKANVNEQHMKDPFFDFEIELIKPAAGLPQPEVITLDQVKDDNDDYIFDPGRSGGCEYYQARLVRLENVEITDPQNWAPGSTITVSDSNGLTFPVLLGIGSGFTMYDCPAGKIDVIGIMDQESSGYMVCKDGYRLWVTNYDGNGLVLTDRGFKRGNLPGDINTDFSVDLLDFARFAENWLEYTPGLYLN